METLLPSEVARLVYGYLLEENCHEAAAKFLETSSQLKECLVAYQNGKKFQTKFEGRNLVEILDVLPQVKTQAQIVAGELPQNSLLWSKELLELLYLLSVNVVPCMESDDEASENDNEQNQLPFIPQSIIDKENKDVPVRLNNFKSSDLSDGSDSCPHVEKDILNQSGIAEDKKESFIQKKSSKDLVLSDIEEEDEHEVIEKNHEVLDEINENEVTEEADSKLVVIEVIDEEDVLMAEKDDSKLIVIEEFNEDVSVAKEGGSELVVIEEINKEDILVTEEKVSKPVVIRDDVLVTKEEDSKIVDVKEVDENEVWGENSEDSDKDVGDAEDTIINNENEDMAQYYKPIGISSYICRYRGKKRGKGGKKWKNKYSNTTLHSASPSKPNASIQSNIPDTKHNSSDSKSNFLAPKSNCGSHSYDSRKKLENNSRITHVSNSSVPKSNSSEAKSNTSSWKNNSSNPISNSSNSEFLSSASKSNPLSIKSNFSAAKSTSSDSKPNSLDIKYKPSDTKSNPLSIKSNFSAAKSTSSDSKPNSLDIKYKPSDTKSKSSGGKANPLAPKSSSAIVKINSSDLKFHSSAHQSNPTNPHPNYLNFKPNFLAPNPNFLPPNPNCLVPKFSSPNLYGINLNKARYPSNLAPLFNSMTSLNEYKGPILYKSPQASPYNPHMMNLQASHARFTAPPQPTHVSGNYAGNNWIRDSNTNPPPSVPLFVNRHVMQTSSYGAYPPSSPSFVQGGVQVVVKKVVTQMINGGHPGVSQSIITNHTLIRPNVSLNQSHMTMPNEQLPRHR